MISTTIVLDNETALRPVLWDYGKRRAPIACVFVQDVVTIQADNPAALRRLADSLIDASVKLENAIAERATPTEAA